MKTREILLKKVEASLLYLQILDAALLSGSDAKIGADNAAFLRDLIASMKLCGLALGRDFRAITLNENTMREFIHNLALVELLQKTAPPPCA